MTHRQAPRNAYSITMLGYTITIRKNRRKVTGTPAQRKQSFDIRLDNKDRKDAIDYIESSCGLDDIIAKARATRKAIA